MATFGYLQLIFIDNIMKLFKKDEASPREHLFSRNALSKAILLKTTAEEMVKSSANKCFFYV